MKSIAKFAKHIPHWYFITAIIISFTYFNRLSGIWAYPILFLGIPFLWQIIRPSQRLNTILGFSLICISSYLILGYLLEALNIISIEYLGDFLKYGIVLVFLGFVMASWIIRNTLRQTS